MPDSTNENSQGRSPFDLPKIFHYDVITDYLRKKAEQLYIVKNYRNAIKEYKALLQCSINNDELSEAREIEEKLIKINAELSLRELSRQKLKNHVDSYISKPDTLNFENLISFLEKFSLEAFLTEEYGKLITIIIQNRIKKISSLEQPESEKLLKETASVILRFDPLKYLLEIGKIELENGNRPFMLFDLDSTLFDNSPRVYKILQEFIKEKKDLIPEDILKLSSLKRENIVWGIRENLKKVNVTTQETVDHIIEFWLEKFFSNDYIIDVPIKGSKNFVNDVNNLNIKIVYLSGRFESMREGTVKNFIENGFPLDEDSENLVLKPNEKIPDHVFKHSIMEKISGFGKMIAGFDNEPQNTNIFKTHFPESEVFFLETNHSLNPPNLMDTIHTIQNFSYTGSD